MRNSALFVTALLYLLLFPLRSVHSQYVEWMQVYGGEHQESGYSVEQTNDGGFIVAGNTYSFGAGSYDFYLVKTDSLGDIEWEKTYGTSARERAYSVQQTSDNGFIIAGSKNPASSGPYDIYVIKTDSMGNVQWDEIYGFPGHNDYCYSIRQTEDNGYIIGGQTDSVCVGISSDIYLIKVDSIGSIQWDSRYGGESGEFGRSVILTSDGGYAIAGSTQSYGAGSSDFYLVKTDSSGCLEWDAVFGGYSWDYCNDLVETTDGGFAIVGYTMSFSVSTSMWVIKTDSSGCLEWDSVIECDLSSEAYGICNSDEGGYVISGQLYPAPDELLDGCVVKLDEEGSTQWRITFGGDSNEMLRSIRQTSDGNYITVGNTGSYGPGLYNIWVVKINAEVSIQEESSVFISPDSFLLNVRPNPMRSHANISYSLYQPAHVTIVIYDISGRRICELSDNNQESGSNSLYWAGTDEYGQLLSDGIYFVQLEVDGKKEVQRLVLLR